MAKLDRSDRAVTASETSAEWAEQVSALPEILYYDSAKNYTLHYILDDHLRSMVAACSWNGVAPDWDDPVVLRTLRARLSTVGSFRDRRNIAHEFKGRVLRMGEMMCAELWAEEQIASGQAEARKRMQDQGLANTDVA